MGKAPQLRALDTGCCRQKRRPLPLPSLDPPLQAALSSRQKSPSMSERDTACALFGSIRYVSEASA
jgi:hypothetical protein